MVKDLSLPRKDLALIRAQVGRSMRTMTSLIEQIGWTPLPDDWQQREESDLAFSGEVLFAALYRLGQVQEMTEELSNYLRRLDQLEPIDYDGSESSLLMATLKEGVRNPRLQWMSERRDGGSPV